MTEAVMLVRDPTMTADPQKVQLSPRPESLQGLKVGIVAQSWEFDIVAERLKGVLKERYGAGALTFIRKENVARPTSEAALNELAAQCDVAITGMGI